MKKMWAVLVLAAFSPLLAAEDPVSFQKQILPILTRQCTGCHQPASKQSDLLLTTYEGFQKGGRKGTAFMPGKPDESVVVGYLTGKISPSMPFGGKQLATEQIDLFKRWILEGSKNDAPPADNIETTKLRPAIYYARPLITALAYSPDGKILAISGYREILLHDAAGGLQARLQGLSQRIHTLAFSPDGKTLVGVGGDPGRFGEVQIWDLASR